MSEEKDREIAQRLILESIVDDKLDFTLLKRKTNEMAQKITDTVHGKGNDFATERDGVVRDLTDATRQVLGFIPEKEWNYDSWITKQLEEKWQHKTVNWKEKKFVDFQKENGLEIYKKDGTRYDYKKSAEEQGYNKEKTLAEQGFVISVSESKHKEIKGSAFNTSAAILRSVVETAHSSQSLAGSVIHEDEAKAIEKKMQNFIGEFNKAPATLTELAKKDIREALTTLEKANVKADYPELGKEMNDLQNILKTAGTRIAVADSLGIKKPSGRH